MKSAPGIEVELQVATAEHGLPGETEFATWAATALDFCGRPAGVRMTVRLVDDEESRTLNENFRGKGGATNVLAFSGSGQEEMLPEAEREFGDLVICVPVVRREAREQEKEFFSHMAHLVVHGTLHLAGHDHDNERNALRMEELEVQVLDHLGFPDPYE